MLMIYRNLHRNTWSIKDGRKPVRHAHTVTLVGGEFRVWQSGCQRVRRERRKTVHAFACGTLSLAVTETELERMVAVSYNPYRNPEQPGSFYRKDTGEDVASADLIHLTADGKVYADNPTPKEAQ